MPARGRTPIAIDLFCDAGGMSLGIEQAGFPECRVNTLSLTRIAGALRMRTNTAR